MHAISRRTAAFTLSSALALGVGLAAVPGPAAQADTELWPVYRVCLATASVGTGTYTDQNYLQRIDPGGHYAPTKVFEGQCKDLTFDSDTYLRLAGYNSYRVTRDLDAPGNSSTYMSCIRDTNQYTPPGNRKVKGYQRGNCTNWAPGE